MKRRGPAPRASKASTRPLVAYLTDDEYDEVRKSAKRAKQSVGGHFRDLALGALADDGSDFRTVKKTLI